MATPNRSNPTWSISFLFGFVSKRHTQRNKKYTKPANMSLKPIPRCVWGCGEKKKPLGLRRAASTAVLRGGNNGQALQPSLSRPSALPPLLPQPQKQPRRKTPSVCWETSEKSQQPSKEVSSAGREPEPDKGEKGVTETRWRRLPQSVAARNPAWTPRSGKSQKRP